MNKHSISPSEQRDTDVAADSAALWEIKSAELEGVNGGGYDDGLPWCGTRPIHVPPPHPVA